MKLSFFSWVILVSAFINLSIGIFVFIYKTKKKLHRSFFVFSAGLSMWLISFAFLFETENIVYSDMLLYGSVIGSLGLFLFSDALYEKTNISLFKWIHPLVLGISFIGIASGLVIEKANINNGVLSPDNGILFPFLALVIMSYCIMSLINMWKFFKQANPFDKNKTEYFFFGLSIFIISVLVFDIFLPLLSYESLNIIGPISSILLMFSTAYALLVKKLMNIRFLLQRGFIYSVLLLCVVGGYLLILFLISPYHPLSNTILEFSLYIVTVYVGIISFPFLERFLKKHSNRWFFNRDYDYSQELRNISAAMASFDSFDDLIEGITQNLVRIFQSESASIIFASPYSQPISNQAIITHANRKIYLPVYAHNKFVASLVLSDKKSGQGYQKRDIDFLQTLAYHMGSFLRQGQIQYELTYRNKQLREGVMNKERHIESININQEKMITDIAHNLQTPLTILKAELHELRQLQSSLTKQEIRFLDQSVDRLSQFITRLLQSAGASSLDKPCLVITELGSFLEKTTDYFEVIAESQGIDIEIRLAENIHARIDPKLFEDMLVNIVSNAMKYRRQNTQHKISINLKADKHTAYLLITDNGIGISKQDLPYIFDRWHQVDKHKKGSGLGLSIVKNITDIHGIDIDIKSVLGEGTECTLRINRC